MDSYNNIIKGVRKNDRRSQMAFYDLFFRPVFQSAFAILGNHDEAEEIMHDTLLKVFSNFALLQEDAGAMTRLLRRISANQAIDVMRKRKDFFVSFDDDDSLDIEDEEDSDIINTLTVADIKTGIGNLSPTYRNIITLRLFEEMSFADIAQHLDINASTVRVQYARGILKLRTLLKQQLYKYEQ